MNFWYQSKWTLKAALLAPLSLLVLLITKFKRHSRSSASYPIPVIVVGNITVGGTGKTPTIIWLANFLADQGYSVGVVSRGYGAKPNRKFPIDVLSTDSPAVVGDEPALILKKTAARVVIDPDRHRAVEMLCRAKGPACDLIISDDGMQHYKMARDIELLMVDPLRGFGNGRLLPAGPLRESLTRLKTVDFILAKQSGDLLPDMTVHIANVKQDMPRNCKKHSLAPQQIKLMSAIGNIESFAKTVKGLGFSIAEQKEFRDHSVLPKDQLENSSIPIVVTEKDFIKIKSPGLHIYYVPFVIDYDDSFKAQLLKRIKEVVSEKSNSHSGSL